MKRVIVTFALSMLALTAMAQGAGREACGPDARRYCSSALGGGVEKVRECLIDHQKEISDACYGFLSNQKSGSAASAGDVDVGEAAASGRSVFRSRQADGSTVYSETPQSNASSAKRVQFLNGNTALPLR